MSANYETGWATLDISAIVAMQELNVHENGGGLSVRQIADWFKRTMSEMPIVVARREGVVVGYALATSGFPRGDHTFDPGYRVPHTVCWT